MATCSKGSQEQAVDQAIGLQEQHDRVALAVIGRAFRGSPEFCVSAISDLVPSLRVIRRCVLRCSVV
eukprot:3941414-Pyramimonas_sp.AAC.1